MVKNILSRLAPAALLLAGSMAASSALAQDLPRSMTWLSYDTDQQWNDARLTRLEALRTAWKDTVATHQDDDDPAFEQTWAKARQGALDAL